MDAESHIVFTSPRSRHGDKEQGYWGMLADRHLQGSVMDLGAQVPKSPAFVFKRLMVVCKYNVPFTHDHGTRCKAR